MTAATRVRRSRQRRRDGIVLVRFEVHSGGIALLAELGWLDPAETQDPAAVRAAFEAFVNAAGAEGVTSPATSRGV